MPSTPTSTFRLDPVTLAELDELAAQDRTTRTGVIRALVAAEIRRRRRRLPDQP
jgi:predicted transcriptional regulator